MLTSNRKRRATAVAIVDAARKQEGYHAQPSKQNGFSPKGYNGKDWNGAFVDRVLTDALGRPEVSFVSTVTALGYYAARNRLYRKPRVGDIVFFNFATDPGEWDHQPHVGVVVETHSDGSFRTVEGQTYTGKPQGVQLANGVHERVRFSADVLAFVRPRPGTVELDNGERSTVRMSYFQSNPKTKRRALETVTTALNRVGIPITLGKKYGEFKSAFGLYARERGTVNNRGELEHGVLNRLGDETGTFTVE